MVWNHLSSSDPSILRQLNHLSPFITGLLTVPIHDQQRHHSMTPVIFLNHFCDLIECHFISKLQQKYLFSSCFRLTMNNSSALLGLFNGTLPATGGFPSQRASKAENISMSWCHHIYWVEIWQATLSAADFFDTCQFKWYSENDTIEFMDAILNGVWLEHPESQFRLNLAYNLHANIVKTLKSRHRLHWNEYHGWGNVVLVLFCGGEQWIYH